MRCRRPRRTGCTPSNPALIGGTSASVRCQSRRSSILARDGCHRRPTIGCQTSILVAALDNLPDRGADILAVLARVRLRRLAPTAIKQDVGGLHARGGRMCAAIALRANALPGGPP